jgi:hypothetical protein
VRRSQRRHVRPPTKILGVADRPSDIADVAFVGGAITIGALVGALVWKVGGVPTRARISTVGTASVRATNSAESWTVRCGTSATMTVSEGPAGACAGACLEAATSPWWHPVVRYSSRMPARQHAPR